MSTIFIRMMLKVFGGRCPIFLCLYIATLSIEFLVWFVFFLGLQTDYSFIFIIKINHSLFHLVAACTSGKYLNGFSGFFSTPNFPSNYPQYSKCTWNIAVPSGYIIKLSFVYFRLEPNQYSPCYYNARGARVTVTKVDSDDGYQPFMLCGQSLPLPVYSVGNSVQVIFTSLNSQYPGFNATYTAITYSSGTWYTRGGLGWVCATRMYRSIRLVNFRNFKSEFLLNGKRPWFCGLHFR